MTVGVVGYVGGEVAVPGPGCAGAWAEKESRSQRDVSTTQSSNYKLYGFNGQLQTHTACTEVSAHRNISQLYLTAWSSSDGREGRRCARGGGLSGWEQVWRRIGFRGCRAAAGWGVLDGLDGVASLYGGQTLWSVKIVFILNHAECWAGTTGQSQSW